MRNLIFFFSIACLLSSCGEETTQRNIVVLHDVTQGDTTSPALDFEPILDMDNHVYQATRFSYTQITDTDYNKTYSFSIEAESELFSNQYEREEIVEDFKQQLGTIDTRQGDELNHSAIWVPLWNQIEEVSKLKNTETTIYLLSDCIENDFINLHETKLQQQLLNDPETVVMQFKDRIPEGFNAHNIHLTICHRPTGKEQNDLYRLIIDNIYHPIMTDAGIEITTRSNLE